VTAVGGAAPHPASRVRRQANLPDDAAALYTVSQVADLLNVQAAFVRRLDAQGVLVPARTSGGQRRYSRHDIDHITSLVELTGEGFTLAGAQRIIELENEIAELRHELQARAPGAEGGDRSA
jgi:excisionase family DNA binding protein